MTHARAEEHIEGLHHELRVHTWAEVRVERAFRELVTRKRHDDAFRLRARRIGGAALAAVVALALVAGISTWWSNGPSRATATVTRGFERIALGDGSEVHFEPGARLDVRERSDTRVVVSVGAGKTRFRVRHDPRRVFRVEAGEVHVEDLGTTFDVEHDAVSVRVSVTEGSVRVSYPDERGEARRTLTLNAGEHGVYPSVAKRVAAEPNPTGETLAARGASPDAPSSSPEAQVSTDWRELARAGEHRRAYELLVSGKFRDVKNEPQDLLLASDVARLSHHPADSVALLRKLLASHERDPRAPSAAFTLGWVLMNELGRPLEAAHAFARAEALAPRGNLAEDAVARAVEAWYRAGELSRAKAEVERYCSSYPNGRHQAMLHELVGTP